MDIGYTNMLIRVLFFVSYVNYKPYGLCCMLYGI